MRHLASRKFWQCFEALPPRIQSQARRNFGLLKQNPAHPSLRLKDVGRYHSVRIGLRYRALGIKVPEGIQWFWIGSHADYDRIIAS